jgi:hypothetical protein
MDIDDFWDAVEGHSGACPDTADAQHDLLEEVFEEIAIELPEPDEAWDDANPHTLVVCVWDFDAHVVALMLPQPEGADEDDLARVDCLHASAPDLARESPEAFGAALRLQAKLGYLTTDPDRMQTGLDGIQGLCEAHGTEAELPSAAELVALCGQWNAHAVGSYDADEEAWLDQECNAALLAKRIANVVVVRIVGDWM